jgi:hypothetical protein
MLGDKLREGIMGVWHFLSLGKSPGAVTSALAYIKKRYEENDIVFFGGDSGRSKAKKVSGMVIFTTPEVWHHQLADRDAKYVDNLYGSDKGQELPLGDAEGKLKTFEVVLDFVKDEFQAVLREEQGKVYWLEASYYDLELNLNQVVRAFCSLSPPGSTGREIWVNLTGGSNVMNIAALLATVMSGVTGRAYYTYTRDIRLLRPANETDFWYDIPVLKVNFDRDYEAILRVLEERGGWVEASELFSRVKQRRPQFRATRHNFAPDYLNKLDGWLIERKGDSNRLSLAGQRFLALIEDDLTRALIYKEQLQQNLLPNEVFEEVLS